MEPFSDLKIYILELNTLSPRSFSGSAMTIKGIGEAKGEKMISKLKRKENVQSSIGFR